MKRAVITGATGAIGSALVNLLVENGIEALVITRKNSKRNDHIQSSPAFKFLYADMSEYSSLDVSDEDREKIENAINDYQADNPDADPEVIAALQNLFGINP